MCQSKSCSTYIMLPKYAHSRQLIIFLFLISYVSVPILITCYHSGSCICSICFVGVFSSLNKSDSYQLLHVVVSQTFCVIAAVFKTRVGQRTDPAVCPCNMDTPKILEDEVPPSSTTYLGIHIKKVSFTI